MFKTGELSKQKLRRFVLPMIALIVLAAAVAIVCAAVLGKVVYIHDGESVTTFKTAKLTVGEALEEAEIIPGEFDIVDPALDAKIEGGMEIYITRAVPLTLIVDGVQEEVHTLSKTVGALLLEREITCVGFDTVLPSAETELTPGMEIVVNHSKNITFVGDGKTEIVSTLTNSVSEMIAAMGLSLSEEDFTEPAMETPLSDGLEVRLVRVTKKTVTDTESVGYEIEEKTTSALVKGKTRIAQAGKNGVRTNTYSVVLHDGEEVSRELVSSEITRKPVNKIIEKGTAAKTTPKATAKPSTASSSGGGSVQTAKGENFTYKKKLTCTAYAYDLTYESCGKRPGDPYYGITASGMKAGPGVIAVDPSVIPLGTRLYVEAVDGSWTYGYCVAGDTGGGIYGNRIDLFFNTPAEVRSFGVRKAVVYIL